MTVRSGKKVMILADDDDFYGAILIYESDVKKFEQLLDEYRESDQNYNNVDFLAFLDQKRFKYLEIEYEVVEF